MTSTEIKSIARSMAAESVMRHTFFFCALVSGFITFPNAKYFVSFCLLFVATTSDSFFSALKLQTIQQKRYLWMLELTNRIGMTKLHRKEELETYRFFDFESIWRESQKEAVEDIKGEDGVAMAGEELDADFNPLLKPRLAWNILAYLLINLVIIAAAFFTAKILENA